MSRIDNAERTGSASPGIVVLDSKSMGQLLIRRAILEAAKKISRSNDRGAKAMEFSVEIASILSRFLARQPEFGINFRESEEYLWWDHERHKLTFEFGPHNPTPTVVLVTNLVPDENADPTALARIAELILLEASCLT